MARDVNGRQMAIPRPRFPAGPDGAQTFYDREGDILIIRFGAAHPATSVDLDGELWLRMDPVSGDVIAIEIEDFERSYLGKYPEISTLWSGLGEQDPQRLPAEACTGLIEPILESARAASTSLGIDATVP